MNWDLVNYEARKRYILLIISVSFDSTFCSLLLLFTLGLEEAAIQWLIDHVEDEDIDVPVSSAPKMSTEEADQKALELQRRVREVNRIDQFV